MVETGLDIATRLSLLAMRKGRTQVYASILDRLNGDGFEAGASLCSQVMALV